jgi:hypothetical protein
LGNYIHRIISRFSASHEIVFRFLGIIAGEETSLKRVRRAEVLSGRVIVDIAILSDTQNNHLVGIAAS